MFDQFGNKNTYIKKFEGNGKKLNCAAISPNGQ
jgi:hypothetical protein